MPFRSYHGTFSPDELDMLKRVFDESMRDCDKEYERQNHAALIIVLFNSGVRDYDDLLKQATEARHRRF